MPSYSDADGSGACGTGLDKGEARRCALAAREALPQAERERLSAALCARLERLLQARARRYVAERPPDLSIYGLDPPEVTLTLGLRDEAGISKTLFVGRSGEHGTFAMIRGRDMVFTVDDATRQDITADLTAGGERGPDAAADSPSPP